MFCRYCGKEKKLIKAHIIPAAFFRRMREGQEPLMILTNKANEYPKRAPIGVYDIEILCKTCESLFGDWDNYAQELLGEELKNGSKIIVGDRIVGYRVNDYNYELLKLFFISLLWRASFSVQSFYSRIKLGPHEATAKKFLENRDPGSVEEFSVTLAKFISTEIPVFLDPDRKKIEGINFCRFYLGNYIAYIKTDKRKAPEWISNFAISPDKPLTILGHDLMHSNELPAIKKILTADNNRYQPTR